MLAVPVSAQVGDKGIRRFNDGLVTAVTLAKHLAMDDSRPLHDVWRCHLRPHLVCHAPIGAVAL